MDSVNRPSIRRGTVICPIAAVGTATLGALVAAFLSLPLQLVHGAEAKPQPASAATPAVLPSEAATATPIEKSPGKDKSSPIGRQLLREGFELRDQLGTFRSVGGRLVFALDKRPTRLVALENLSLERVARVMAENPAAIEWRVSGVVSEYRGVNYVLIERAVLRNTSAEPPPATPPAEIKPKATASH